MVWFVAVTATARYRETDLDAEINYHNDWRDHRGKMRCGCTPLQTLRESKWRPKKRNLASQGNLSRLWKKPMSMVRN